MWETEIFGRQLYRHISFIHANTSPAFVFFSSSLKRQLLKFELKNFSDQEKLYDFLFLFFFFYAQLMVVSELKQKCF